MKNYKESVIYQIWPRSFCDSNGDGIGDLLGIVSKLDYIRSLGVDYIWLSPIYSSPNKDYGYDIDDYYKIHPDFGTMEDFDLLLSEAKKRGMNLIMDLVANHTSDQHPWFQEAIHSKESKYRDYYYFRDGKPGEKHGKPVTLPPNNWMSAFGGSAWQYDETSDQYYLTLFTPEQCDLNWTNPEVRNGVYDIMRFWLDKGIAGFRLDVINAIAKTQGLPDAGNPDRMEFPFEHVVSLPESHVYIHEMYEKVLKHYDCFTIGEGMVTDLENLNLYTAPEREELTMMFQFDLHMLGCGKLGKYDFRKFYHYTVKDMKQVIDHWQTGSQNKNGWLANYLSNHDQPRQVSRFGDDKRYRIASAKALALLNFTLRGTPFIYQGEEIGMTNLKLPKNEWKDYEAINDYKVLKQMHLPAFLAKKVIQKMTRDNARTPMQWSPGTYAGFSTAWPWMKLNPNYDTINVATDLISKDSLIQFYQSLAQLRTKYPVLCYGKYIPLCENNKKAIAFLREFESTRLVITINLSSSIAHIDLSSTGYKHGVLLLGTHLIDGFFLTYDLQPYEGRVYLIK